MGTPLSCGVMAVLLILFAHQEQQRGGGYSSYSRLGLNWGKKQCAD